MKLKLTYAVGAVGLYYWLFKKPAAAGGVAGYGAMPAGGLHTGLPGPTIAIQGGGLVVTQAYNPLTGFTGSTQPVTPGSQPIDPAVAIENQKYMCQQAGGQWSKMTNTCVAPIIPEAQIWDACAHGVNQDGTPLYLGQCDTNPGGGAGSGSGAPPPDSGFPDLSTSKLPLILGGAAALYFLLKR